MLFCTEGCISVVDKTTDPCCFVFYIEREGKTPGVTSLYLLEKDRGELSTRCLMPTLLGRTLLLFSWNASPQRSNYCPSGREFGPFQLGYRLSSLIYLILAGKRTVQVQRHIRRRDALFLPPLPLFFGNPVLPHPHTSHHKMQVETVSLSCQGWGQVEILCRNSGKLTELTTQSLQ